MAEEPEITTASEKGQVVIPQSLRKEMGIKSRTKFVVLGSGNTVIMKRLEFPDLRGEWSKIFEMMDQKKSKRLSENEILAEIQATRKEEKKRALSRGKDDTTKHPFPRKC
ncbi:MAG TPA: AbrB/MazE/SpoVT family DNA-binding domain-containing protein [Nitrososphaerales archaeon]|nr:AbrB/MazE/SpoVT family DNA-binding domain-containing protein [Nitrososphaerales archaeon]